MACRLSRVTSVALAALALLAGRPASSKPRVTAAARVCMAAYRGALKLEREARLIDAERFLASCARASCGAVIQNECLARHARLDADIPSVVPLLTDEDDAPVLAVDVSMDGAPLTSVLDGRAVSIDPGLHEFTFTRNDQVVATRKLVIAQGRRNQTITVALRPAEATQPPPPPVVATSPVAAARLAPAPRADKPLEDPRPPLRMASYQRETPAKKSSVAPYLLTVVGLAGIGGYPLLTYWGRKDNQLLAQCAPNCAPASVTHIRQLYIAADVSLGVGLAALVGATWIALSSGGDDKETRRSRYAFDLRPGTAGAVASISGAF